MLARRVVKPYKTSIRLLAFPGCESLRGVGVLSSTTIAIANSG